jgi:hypothetical protein
LGFALVNLSRVFIHPPSGAAASDFKVPWAMGRLLMQGNHPLDEEKMRELWFAKADTASQLVPGSQVLPAIYPPQTALVYLPLAILPYALAWKLNFLICLLSIAWLVLSLHRLSSHYGFRTAPWLILVLILACKGTVNAVIVGQPTFIALAAAMHAWVSWLRGRDEISALCLGIALFKFTVAIPVLAMLWLAGKRKLCFMALGIALLFFLPVWWVAGSDLLSMYFSNLHAWRAFCFDATRPAFPLVYELTAFTEVAVLRVITGDSALYVLQLALLVFGGLILYKRRYYPLEVYLLFAFASLIFIQHLYYDVLLLLPLFLIWLKQAPSPAPLGMLAAALCLLVLLPVNRLLDLAQWPVPGLYFHHAWLFPVLLFLFGFGLLKKKVP